MQISGETTHSELSHPNVHCLQKPVIAIGIENLLQVGGYKNILEKYDNCL